MSMPLCLSRSRLFVLSRYAEDVPFVLPLSCTVGKSMCLL